MPSAADKLYIGAGAYLADAQVESFDEDDVAPAGFVGYQFLDSNFLMLSAEVGYYALRDFNGSSAGIDFAADASALTVAGVAYLPLGPFFEVYAKAAAARLKIDGRIGDERFNEDGTELFGGVGVALDVFDTVDFYAEYLQFDNAIDSRMVGVGIRLDFF
jgi:hypothetical protein